MKLNDSAQYELRMIITLKTLALKLTPEVLYFDDFQFQLFAHKLFYEHY